jgi:hypothetical protein
MPILQAMRDASALYFDRAVGLRVRQGLPFDDNLAAVDGFQLVQAAQERTLAAAGRADDGHHFPLPHFEIDAPENLEGVETFLDILRYYFIHLKPLRPIHLRNQSHLA